MAAAAAPVYATFTGPVPPRARLWAALLYSGRGAALAGRTALWLSGASQAFPEPIEVAVPIGRQVRRQRGIAVHARRGLAEAVHPAAPPPPLRLEEDDERFRDRRRDNAVTLSTDAPCATAGSR